jgi:hypothetical protein
MENFSNQGHTLLSPEIESFSTQLLDRESANHQFPNYYKNNNQIIAHPFTKFVDGKIVQKADCGCGGGCGCATNDNDIISSTPFSTNGNTNSFFSSKNEQNQIISGISDPNNLNLMAGLSIGNPQPNQNLTRFSNPDCISPWKQGIIRNIRITPIYGIGPGHGCLVNIYFCYIDNPACFMYYFQKWEFSPGGADCTHHWEDSNGNITQPPDFDNRVRELIMTADWYESHVRIGQEFAKFADIPNCSTGKNAKFCRVSRAVCMKAQINRDKNGRIISIIPIICKLSACVTQYEVCETGRSHNGETSKIIKPIYKGVPKEFWNEIGGLFGIYYFIPGVKGTLQNPFDCPTECTFVCGND